MTSQQTVTTGLPTTPMRVGIMAPSSMTSNITTSTITINGSNTSSRAPIASNKTNLLINNNSNRITVNMPNAPVAPITLSSLPLSTISSSSSLNTSGASSPQTNKPPPLQNNLKLIKRKCTYQ